MEFISKNVEDQLQDLRQRWLTATPANRKVIEIRAKLLKMGQGARKPTTEEEVTNIFLNDRH